MFDNRLNNLPERTILVGAAFGKTPKSEIEYSLSELSRLTETAGGIEVGRFLQKRPKPDGGYYIGRGMADEIKARIEETEAELVIFDDILSPYQQRNLGEKFEIKTIDRAMLILDIFALHANTAESRLQVELAQMEYMLPRLTGLWVHLSRQRGGIGTKGPGETQLEVDRRQVTQKIASLKHKLTKIEKQRQTQRKARMAFKKIALVGYTNAGKSTLFNRLTRAKVIEADQLFSTLDSTTRVMSVNYPQKVVLTDTVGFIEKLPHQLVASFKSTLEEVKQADLILLVVDSSDMYRDRKIDVVKSVLEDIGAAHIPKLMIYNKIDLIDSNGPQPWTASDIIPTSAIENTGITRLKTEIIARFG